MAQAQQNDTAPRNRPSNEVGSHDETNARPNTTDAVEEAIDEGGPGISPFPSTEPPAGRPAVAPHNPRT